LRSLAIIPARGGSKRIPGKNLAEVGGVSLVRRAIDAGAVCDVVMVSTDESSTEAHARPYLAGGIGAVHARKPEHATDEAQLEPVIADVLEQYDGDGFDAIVLLQPTSPFRTYDHVAEALRILETTGCDSVVSVTRLHSLHPGFNGHYGDWYATDDGCFTQEKPVPGDAWRYRHPDTGAWAFRRGAYVRTSEAEAETRPASASLGHLVYENGAIYAFTRAHWDRTGSRMGGDMRALVMHWSEAVDIDTPEDLEAARRMAR